MRAHVRQGLCEPGAAGRGARGGGEAEERAGSPKSAPVLGEPELQAMARREFAISPWDFRRLGAALTLTEAEIDKLSRYYFGLN